MVHTQIPKSDAEKDEVLCTKLIYSNVKNGKVAFREEYGNIIAAATKTIATYYEVTVAEALCLRWALQLSGELLITKVQYETDCLRLFQA
ncbi:pentatricopeptide repeat-containing protein mitochondrial [Spatholobus suberectus]|nr:pentatricopeptide repeat-containing protein mitochondrial [Spatholobus suberectus]